MIFVFLVLFPLSLLSSRTKRSEVKDLVFIHVDVLETLRYALSDNWFSRSGIYQDVVSVCHRAPCGSCFVLPTLQS